MKKKLLIAGGGYADVPLIIAAQRLGYYVITSGNRPEDLGHRISDEYAPADFSDRDAMLKLAKRLRIEAICACANDFSALSCAYVAEKLDLPGHDPLSIAETLHHKDAYRVFAATHGIPTPKAGGFSTATHALQSLNNFKMPIIVKPVDLTGGKGIAKIDFPSEASTAVDNAFRISRIKRVVIEEFLDGSRHGFSCFIRDGRVVFHFTDDEHYYLNPYMVAAASAPGTVPQSAVRMLIGYTETIARLLSLKTGIVHIQFILRGGEPIIIEICRRSPGDLYIRFVEHATGVDYPNWIVRAAAGLNCSDLMQRDVGGYVTRHCLMAPYKGHLQSINIDPSIAANIIEQTIWGRKGEYVEDWLNVKLGVIFLRFVSADEMRAKTEQLHHLIAVRVH